MIPSIDVFDTCGTNELGFGKLQYLLFLLSNAYQFDQELDKGWDWGICICAFLLEWSSGSVPPNPRPFKSKPLPKCFIIKKRYPWNLREMLLHVCHVKFIRTCSFRNASSVTVICCNRLRNETELKPEVINRKWSYFLNSERSNNHLIKLRYRYIIFSMDCWWSSISMIKTKK